ncbi:MAG TPA: alpha/beta hydrolase [Micromonospora sp.]|nr:alpha/beta hydrolase [Micromonospora sp.]
MELRPRWSGPASRSAGSALDTLRARLDASRSIFLEVDQVLAEQAAALERAKALLAMTVTSAAASGVLIDRRGVASPDPARRPELGGAAVREAAAGIRTALELAAAADRETARRLSDLAAEVIAGCPAEPPPSRPSVTAEPSAVRTWWEGLTTAQRRWLIQHEPDLVGRLDGVPVAARDQANRLLLEAQQAALLQRRAQLGAQPLSPWVRRELARLDGALAGLAAVAARLDTETGPRSYLLSLDPAGDGRAIVAIGNPDRADNVLTYVPGMGSGLSRVEGELKRVSRMVQRCVEVGPTEQTAAVLWLDYDAPDFLHEAYRDSFAHRAGPALHRFQEGLLATHDGPAAHRTVLGHSYGSLVVGATARDHGLAADNLVFVGSPGVGVERAGDLGVPADQVWSTTARNDIIQYAAPTGDQALKRLWSHRSLPGLGPLVAFLTPHEELWFGHNPSHPGFGGQVFDGSPRGHAGYWDRNNPALDSMARIILGGHHQPALR